MCDCEFYLPGCCDASKEGLSPQKGWRAVAELDESIAASLASLSACLLSVKLQ